MTGAELKAWRESEGLTQPVAAARFEVSLRVWKYYEKGERVIPAMIVAATAGKAPEIVAPLAAQVQPARIALGLAEGKPDDAAPEPFDPIASGLKPYPRSNTQWGASINFDTRKVEKPWQRVPKCARVVHNSIPNPIAFYPPAWAGWRGVPTADGRVFDFETGHEMRQAARKEREAAAYGSRLKNAGGKAKR